MNRSTIYFPAVLIIVYVVVLYGGFMALAITFQFPDILRAPVAERLALFIANSNTIIPAYYLLALTGLMQIIFAIALSHLVTRKTLVLQLATWFGALCGLFQLLGFIRWPVLIPYLASLHTTDPATASALEGAFNHYLGMTVGEHLGFLMQGFWMVCLGWSLLGEKLMAPALAGASIIIGVLLLLVSLEPLNPAFAFLGELLSPVLRVQLVWLLLIAVSLLRTPSQSLIGPAFGGKAIITAVVLLLLLSLPSLLR